MSAVRPRLLAAARPEETARALANRHGPPDLRPALRKDLKILRQVQMGDVVWIVKDPRAQKYYQFKNTHWKLISLFNGVRTRAEILEKINRVTGDNPLTLDFVLEYEDFLRERELIEQSAAERSLTLLDKFRTLRQKTAEEKSEGFNIFFIMFHVLDPDRFLKRTVKYVRWIWTPPVAIATCLASLWTVGVFVEHWEPIWRGTKDLYSFLGKPFLDMLHFFVILSIIGLIHEFSHGYAAKIYGGEVHDIGFALFYFTPAFYCDTSDTFMFRNRFHRLWVTVAGMYTEVIICCAATALWVASYPDTFVNRFAYKTMLLTGASTVFFNINPLIKIDGYYALCSLLQLSDLREGAWHTVGAWFQKTVLRLPVEMPVTTRRKRRFYWIYGVFSIAYTTMIMFFIYRLFDNFYTKFFPDIGVVFLILTLYYVFRKKMRTTLRVGKLLYLDKKELLMSPRSRLPFAGLAVLLLLVLFVPWPRRTISAEALLRPSEQASVQSPEDGVVSEVLVNEGGTVERGQPVFRISSAAVEEAEQHALSEREMFTRKSSADRAVSNATLSFQSDSRASAAQTALETAQSRQKFLIVRSPIRGQILSHRPGDLLGRHVPAGFELAQIGDCRRMVAEVAVPERFLEYLQVGEKVVAQIQTRPLATVAGSLAAVSPATLEQPATAAGGKEADTLSAHPDRFVALVVFENRDGTLLPGAQARIKIRSRHESYGARAWSVFWRWLRAVIW